MKIAVLGSGGREHAIAWKLGAEIGPKNVFVLPGNGGTQNNAPINISDFDAIKAFCLQNDVELIFVGPEVPLSNGIVDFFKDSPIRVFGPTQAAARLESSKIFAKIFMSENGVRTADYWICENTDDAVSIVEQLNGDMVIKYDGLAGGKGVFVCSSAEEGVAGLKQLSKNFGSNCRFLIERRLIGYEVSLIGITDGQSIKLLHPSQDHKQLLDGDKGPNTGGMGAYCPFPLAESVLQSIKETIINPTLKGIQGNNMDYKGIIYFGIMVCEDGPYLLEYNVRFGDPETEVLLPAMQSSLSEAVWACLNGSLENYDITFNNRYWIDVVLAAAGYPGSYTTGLPIEISPSIAHDTLVFHAGTERRNSDGQLVVSGGRVLNVVVGGNSLAEAIGKAYIECEKINFDGVQYRRDIGQRKM